MRSRIWLAGALFSAAFGACGGDNGRVPDVDAAATGSDAATNPDVDVAATVSAVDSGAGADQTAVEPNIFSSSACKSDTAAKKGLARIRSLKVIDNQAGLDGLRCVAWERVSTSELKLDLFNFDAGCAATWNGDGAVAADGALALHVDNPSCQPAPCAICLFDWSFDLHVNVAADQAVAVDLTISSCAGQQPASQRSAVIGPEAKGLRCTLASYGGLNWQANAAGTCGKAGMPCVGSLLCGTGSFTSTGTCADGLVCDSSAAVNEPVCFVPCTTVTDCPRTDVYTCQAGLCRPAGLGS